MAVTPNAAPTGYNSAYTGPQIDAAVGAVIDKETAWDAAAAGKLPAGGEVGQVLEKTGAEDNAAEWRTPPFIVRPNLLDNWYFVGGGSQRGDGVFPINQRGQNSYSGQIPAIDRWKLANAAASLTIPDSNDRIIVSSEGSTALYQDLVPSPLFGKTVTFSVLAADNSLYSVTANVPETMPSGYVVLAQIANKIRIATTGDFVRCQVYNGEWIAAKLELGDCQTLAHQENGVWVLNELPDFVEELHKCQRYYYSARYTIAGAHVCIGNASQARLLQCILPIPTPMAKVPGISVENILATKSTNAVGVNIVSATINNFSYYSGIIGISLVPDADLITGETYLVRTTTNSGGITLDATL